MATASRGQVRPSVWWLTCSGCLAALTLMFLWRYNAGSHTEVSNRVAKAPEAAMPSVVSPTPASAPPGESPAPQVVNVATAPGQPSPAPVRPMPTPRKNVQAAALAGELLPRYHALKKHLALVEAKRKEILERDPDLTGINQAKMRQVAGSNAIVALAQALDDPVYRTMLEDTLQNPGALEDFRKLITEWIPKLEPNLPVKDVRTPAELIFMIQEASPAMQARREALYKKLEVDEELAVMTEDGISTGLISNFVEHYMTDAGWHLDPTAQTFSPP